MLYYYILYSPIPAGDHRVVKRKRHIKKWIPTIQMEKNSKQRGNKKEQGEAAAARGHCGEGAPAEGAR